MPVFELDFTPRKRRPRITRKGSFDPKANKEEAAAIRAAFLEQVGSWECPEHGAKVRIDTFRKMPKSRPKRVESEPDVYKPDADNIEKAVLDALTGLAWEDDRMVVDSHTVKNDRTRRERDLVRVVISDPKEGKDDRCREAGRMGAHVPMAHQDD